MVGIETPLSCSASVVRPGEEKQRAHRNIKKNGWDCFSKTNTKIFAHDAVASGMVRDKLLHNNSANKQKADRREPE
jgi:hypothetical protein